MTEPTPSSPSLPRPPGRASHFFGTSVFAWPAGWRLLAVLPALLLLWLGVAWAMPGVFW